MNKIKQFFNKDPQSPIFIVLIYIAYNVTVTPIRAIIADGTIYELFYMLMLAGLVSFLVIEMVRSSVRIRKLTKQDKESNELTRELNGLKVKLNRLKERELAAIGKTKRYFYINYTFNGGTGAQWFDTPAHFNNDVVVDRIYKKIKAGGGSIDKDSIIISNWKEFNNKDDYENFGDDKR